MRIVAGVDVEHDARVVARRKTRSRPPHVPMRVPEESAVSGHHLDRVGTGPHERRQHTAGPLAIERSAHDDVDATDDGRGSSDVIGIPVRQDEEIDAPHPEERKARLERRWIGPGVDEGRLTT